GETQKTKQEPRHGTRDGPEQDRPVQFRAKAHQDYGSDDSPNQGQNKSRPSEQLRLGIHNIRIAGRSHLFRNLRHKGISSSAQRHLRDSSHFTVKNKQTAASEPWNSNRLGLSLPSSVDHHTSRYE